MIDYLDAEDELNGIATAAWNTAVAGEAIKPLIYPPDQIPTTPDPTLIYASYGFNVVREKQAAMSRYQGVSRYETVGLFAVQVYAPKTDVAALRKAKRFAQVVHDAFCKPSPSSEIWFRDQRLTPVPGDATRNQVNVVVTCTYQTTK